MLSSLKNSKAFTLIELMVVIVIVTILALALVPLFKKEMARARYTEGVTALGAMQTKIKVAQQMLGRLPNPVTSGTLVPGLCRMVSTSGAHWGYEGSTFLPNTAGAGDLGKSPAQIEIEADYDEYKGAYFVNENYQYRLLQQVLANGSYAYAIACIGTEASTNYSTIKTKSKVGSAYAIFVRNCPAAAGTTTFLTLTYTDESGDDSSTHRVLTVAGEEAAVGRILCPAYTASDASIGSLSVGASGGKWSF